MIRKYFQYFIVVIFCFLVTACKTFEMDDNDFTPDAFIESKKEQIQDTAVLGPSTVSTKDPFAQQTERRIYIDENVITDYTKIINKTFSQSFPISINFDNVEIRTVMKTFSVITGKNIFSVVSYAWSGLGSSFGPVLVLSLWWPKTTRKGVIAGLLTGFSSTIIWANTDLKLIISERLVSFIFAFIMVILVSYTYKEES